MRQHDKYLGHIQAEFTDENTRLVLSNCFKMISEIHIFDWRMEWFYDTFVSTSAFNNEAKPISDLRRQFSVEGQEFIDVKTAMPTLFNTLDIRFRNYAKPTPSENAIFQSAHFKTLDYVLDISYLDGGDLPSRRFKDDIYHQTITENFDIIGFDSQQTPGLIPVLHQLSANKDSAFFAGTTLVLPEV